MYNSLLPGQFCTPGTFPFGHSVVLKHGGRGAIVLADVPTLLTLPRPGCQTQLSARKAHSHALESCAKMELLACIFA